MKKHFLDKPILQHLFWFIVLPHSLRAYIESQAATNQEAGDDGRKP